LIPAARWTDSNGHVDRLSIDRHCWTSQQRHPGIYRVLAIQWHPAIYRVL